MKRSSQALVKSAVLDQPAPRSNTLFSLSKRIRLDDFTFPHSSELSVYERIFKMADQIRRSLDRKPNENRSSPSGSHRKRSISLELPSASFPGNRTIVAPSSGVLSSTPFTKLPDKELPYIQSERGLYQRILSQATVDSVRHRRRHSFDPPVTIVIDENEDAPSSNPLTLQRCPLSPIHSLKKTQSFLKENAEGSATKEQKLARFESKQVDQQVRSWLRSCEQTPYLSDQWLANLTTNYQADARQRARERQLAECRVKHWEKQRELTERQRMQSLEQRLACLLLTPPVLPDPYLVPQPIPIELPYRPRKVDSIAPPLPVLNESQLSTVETLLRTGSLDTVVTKNFNITVTRKELMTLAGTNWLSDVIINFYLQLLSKRSQLQSQPRSTPLPRVAVMNSFFYAKLSSPTGYSGVRRWSRQLNLLDQELILIPIHDRGMHWCLACIDLKSKTISYYDSMGSSNDKCLETLKSYLQSECEDKKGHPLPDPQSWQLINTEDTVPQQHNGSDCGVFLCTFGEFLSRRAPLTFTQNDMPSIRQRMIFEIATQQLLTTCFQLTAN